MTALEEIKKALEGVTPGPWKWFGNADSNHVYLATTHSGRRYVMDFVRWGIVMQRQKSRMLSSTRSRRPSTMSSLRRCVSAQPSPAQEANTMVTDEMVEKAADEMARQDITFANCDRTWQRRTIRAALETALSAAEPVSSRNDEAKYVEFLNQDVPYIVHDVQGAVAILVDLETRNVIGYRVYDPDSVFAPPAPSVAVKALEWNPFRAETPFGYYHIDDQTDRSPEELNGRLPFLLSGSRVDLSRHPTLADARVAAQTDYEARIRSALSAPVQDVAGVSPGDYMLRHDAAVAAYEANTPSDYRYSALALRKAVDAAFAVAAAPAKQEG